MPSWLLILICTLILWAVITSIPSGISNWIIIPLMVCMAFLVWWVFHMYEQLKDNSGKKNNDKNRK